MVVPGTTVGPYRVEAVLGTGAMARVYRVRHVDDDTVHAMKVLLGGSSRHQRRLLQEGRSQGSLRHPNLVALDDLLEQEGFPVLVMELVNGPSLAELLRARRLSLEQVDQLGQQVLGGLAAAHAHGVVHRDLKPANILLQLDGEAVVAKLGDFGLAKFLDSQNSETRSNAAMGTVAYMAPEQIGNAKNAGVTADVYAAGTVLYQVLTGRRAFRQNDLIARYKASEHQAFVPAKQHRPEAPPRMIEAIEAAMTFEAEQRPRDAGELLALWCGGETGSVPTAQWTKKEREQLQRLVLDRVADGSLPPTWDSAEPGSPKPDLPPVRHGQVWVGFVLGMLAALLVGLVAFWVLG